MLQQRSDHSALCTTDTHRLGKPSATQLPLYGNKVLALRNGTITMHGQHKTPTWTKLAGTADVGARNVTVMGDVTGSWNQGKEPSRERRYL